jgi:transcriptional regulator GlxA family with amidase domain
LIQATAVNNDSLDNDDSCILHRPNVANMVNWMKQNLDTYLGMAEMACEWNVEPS